MSYKRSFARWLPTFLGFPLGGFGAFHTVGSVDGPLTAALAGALAGAIIGAAQWLALRSRGTDLRWVVLTSLGMAVGSSVAAAVTDADTSVGALVTNGFVTGAVVGVAQAFLVDRDRRSAAIWAAVTSLAWGLGWLITANVIVDADSGYITFGASGAIVATVLTGLALPLLHVPSPQGRAPATPAHAVESGEG
jgi:hypothetical protein